MKFISIQQKMNHEIFDVKGMNCASCATIISKRINKLSGVQNCDVNYAVEKATINYDPSKVSLGQMNNEIEKLGYSINPHSKNNAMPVNMESMNHNMESMGDMSRMDHSEHLGLNQSKKEKLQELQKSKNKVLMVLPLTIIVFVVMVWSILSQVFTSIPIIPISMSLLNPILFIIASFVLFYIGKVFVLGAFRFFRYGAANMDTLVGLGTLTAYIYSSLILLFTPIRDFLNAGENTYFDVVVVVIGFITLGKYLEARSKLQTGEAIEKLVGLQAKTALIERDGHEIEIPIIEVKINYIVIVKPGGKIPVDGIIVEGSSSIDESMITGEPIPVDKKIEDKVIGSTINKQGSFKFRATGVGNRTVLAQIIKLVESAQGSRAPIQRLADQISAVFIPTVLVLAVVTLLAWILIGVQFMPIDKAFSLGLVCFVGILVIACPCALGLATPTGIIVGTGKGAVNGILIKNAESLERFQKINVIVLDKTGTITKGKPEVTDIFTITNEKITNDSDMMQILASLEKKSEHPLAEAIVTKAMEIEFLQVMNFRAIEGKGLTGIINGQEYYAGNLTLAHELGLKIDENQIINLTSKGKTPIIFSTKEKVIGIIGISDTIKEEAKEAIAELQKQDIKVIMLTGDNKLTAKYIADQVGIDEVIAEVLPQDKSNEIKKLQSQGYKVAMVGDGINDAPALATADVGVAMGTGTDVAIESAQITLLGGNISKLPKAIKLSKMTMRIIKQNLFWAFIYNIIGIPIAAGLLYPFFGILLNPIFAGAAMAFSSVSVVLNALRLKTLKL